MASKTRTPEKYRAPLKNRKDMAGYIMQHTCPRGNGNMPGNYGAYCHPFCVNVKCLFIDLTFDHLVEVFRTSGGNPDEADLERARGRYEEIADDLFEDAIESARAYWVGFPGEEKGADSAYQLADGTPFEAKYGFYGRSGGWLSIDEFEGFKFAGDQGMDYWRSVLEGKDDERSMGHQTLRRLYRLIILLDADLGHGGARREVEYHAAQIVFMS